MAKKRTRKQKEKAKHQFTISWSPSTSSSQPEAKRSEIDAYVKRQTKQHSKQRRINLKKEKYAKFTAKGENLASIKKDLVKSLIIASLILSLEVVLYLKLQ